MPRIIIREKDFDGNVVKEHFYRKPSGKLEDVTKLEQITGGKPHFYATGMGAKLQAYPKLQPVLRRLEIVMARELELDVDYTWLGDSTATAGAGPARPYSSTHEE